MSRILLAATPAVGHVRPMLNMALPLVEEGHQVFFQTGDLFAAQVEAAGMTFLPLLGKANFDHRRIPEQFPELLDAATPDDRLNAAFKYVFGDCIPDQYRGLQQAIAEHNIDLIMSDVLLLGVLPLLLNGESRPHVIGCGVVAPLWLDPASSAFTGPDDAPGARERNIADNEKLLSIRAPGHQHIDAVLEQVGVKIPGGFHPNSIYRLPDLFLQLGTEAFEYPMEDRPDNLVFTGPFLPKESSKLEMPEWMAKLDPSKPIILVTQGTVANFDFDQLINPALAGLAGEPVQVVATAGGSERGKIQAAGNAIIESYVPYELLLPMTSVFITNGGYNGVQQALAYGVPVVCYGTSEDKPRVSARVAWSGAGVSLKGGEGLPAQIRDAVREILRNSSYAGRAKAIAVEIKETDARRTVLHHVNATLAKAEVLQGAAS